MTQRDSFVSNRSSLNEMSISLPTSSSDKEEKEKEKSSSKTTLTLPPPPKRIRVSHEVIPKEDIRRQFIEIFLSTLNSYDKKLLARVFKEYCNLDLVMAYKVYTKESNLEPVRYVEVVNRTAVRYFWELIWLGFPDGNFEIKETKMRMLQNGFTSAVCRYVYVGTQTADFALPGKKETIIYSVNDPITKKPTFLTCPMDLSQRKLVESETKELQLGNLLAQPMTCIYHGTFTVFINPSKRILKIEFVQTVKEYYAKNL